MPNPLVSIIVPIYNAEKTLHRCIDSILKQTYTNYELLLINDGSTDGSSYICFDYQNAENNKESRIKILNKPNGGVSSARNAGLEMAKGEWITFIDADDWVEADYLENMLPMDNEDFIMDSSSETILPNGIFKDLDVACTGYCIREPWGKFFKTSIINQHALRFDCNLSLGEDLIFCLNYLAHIRKIRTSDTQKYIYKGYATIFKQKEKSFFY